MKKTEIKKNDFRPWVLLVVLIILQVVLGRMVLKQQQEVLVQTDFSRAQSDISVIKMEAKEALQRKDYQAADHFIRKWGENHTDCCAEIRLTAANGFVISEYRRPEPAAEQYVLSEDFAYSYRGRAWLEMVRDLGPVQAALFRLKRILILAGILTTVLFSYALWQVVLRQREAFALQERTIALDEAVRHLRIEIDERLRVEEALEFSNVILATQQETSLDGILVVDKAGRMISFNQRFLEMWNIPPEVAESRSIEEALLAVQDNVVDQEHFVERLRFLDEHKHEKAFDEILLKDGRIFDRYSAPMLGTDGKYLGRVRYFRDVTERKKAQEALVSEKERLAVTLRSIGDAVITTDIEGRIVMMNRVAEKLTGWLQDEAVGRPLPLVFNIINEKTREPCENPVEKVLATGEIIELANHTALLARDGTEIVIADSGAPIRDKESRIIGVVLVFRDITLEKRMMAELILSKNIESVGTLAGGIAHDFNNILTAILGNISLAKIQITPEDPVFERLEAVEKASLRAKTLTQQLITFSKGGAPVRKTASIVDILEDSTGFVLQGSNVRCELVTDPDLWMADVDEGQISQVVSNLVINADQAMAEGGTVIVKAQNFTLAGNAALPLEEGRYVKISVEDTGEGIPPENLSKIFDPYFTTKNKGSGLGLASTYSIVNNHGGCLDVESEIGGGSIFHVFLPVSGEQQTPADSGKAEEVVRGKGRILVMDDEEAIKDTLGKMLGFIGYEADFAGHGEEAIDIYRKALTNEPYDAVILDLTIPGGMGGKETIRQLRALTPDIKAIVSSGYSSDPVMAEYRSHGFCGVIIKPYSMQDLSRVLGEILADTLDS